GPRYDVSDVKTEGITYFTDQEIKRRTDVLVDRRFKGERLVKVIDEIRALYGNQGYIDTEVRYRLDKHPETSQVSIILQVQESPVSYVGDIRLLSVDYDYEMDLTSLERF